MRIALLSDIHANLPALQACLQSIDDQKPDAIYCLGDLVGYNVWPNEVVNTIRSRNIPTIAGNYDEGIGHMTGDCGCAYKTEKDKEMGTISIAYTNNIMQPGERAYLRSLPAHIRITFRCSSGLTTLMLVHGSPRKVNEYLFEDRDEKSMRRIMEDAGAHILCFGHTHKPYHRIISSEKNGAVHFLHAINTGSVGKPKDNDRRGCYVLLHINEQSSIMDKDLVKVEFVRFDYDVEQAAKAVEESPLPDEYADMLRNAY
jgi:predicted phosphodiesterase